jgi:peptide/nickel transport system substrate-binding protein
MGWKTFSVAVLIACFSGVIATPPDTLVIQTGGEPASTLDPHQAYDESNRILENTYETLYSLADQYAQGFEPLLATSHEVSEDGLTYTFTLREGVVFHSGNPFSCADAEYSFRRYLTINNFDSPAFIVSRIVLGFDYWDEETIATTPYTTLAQTVSCNEAGQLVVRLVVPDAAALLKLSTGVSVIDSQLAIESEEWSGTEEDWSEWLAQDVYESSLNDRSGGTGAYQVVNRSAEQVVLQAFDRYWEGVPALINVIVQSVPNQDSRVLAIKNGDADLVTIRDRQALELFSGVPGVVVTDDLPAVSSRLIYMNQVVTPSERLGSGQLDGAGIPPDFFTDVHVRRAFTFAFDYQKYVDEVLGGKAEIVNVAMPSFYAAYDKTVDPTPFSLEQAEAEFKQAWGGQVWEKGFVLEAAVRADNSDFLAALEILKETVEQLNPKFQLVIKQETSSTLYAAADAGELPMVIDNSSLDFPDPDALFSSIYRTGGYDNTWLGFSNAEVDQLIDEARIELDPQQRAALYSQLTRLLQDLAPIVLVPIETRHRVSREELQGYRKNINLATATDVPWKKLSKK